MNSLFQKHVKKGVIHIGAHKGEERDLYRSLDLNVLWIEALPSVFERLSENIKNYPKQTCLNCLVTDVDDKEYSFKISSQTSRSSYLDFTQHHYSDKNFAHTSSLDLKGKRMDTLIRELDLDLSKYDCLVTDCQGSDYEVLVGFGDLIRHFGCVYSEVMIKPIYQGQKLERDVDAYLKEQGFRRVTNFPYRVKRTQRDNFYVNQSGKD
jgi:FkbM family methyltransferase